jgi:dipeptidyl aminopeptidase/acylaminoacyl peptidase
MSDQGGNELDHLFVLETNGTPKDLTPGEKVKAMFAGWTGDKKAFWVLTNERDPKFFDIYRYTTDGYSKQLIFTNKDGWDIGSISKDGRWVALNKVRNNADSDIYVWDSSNSDAAPKHITPHQGNIVHGALSFTADGKELYYSTNERSEFDEAWSYDLASGERKPIIQARWDVAFVGFSENGRYRVSATNEDARTVITVIDTKTGRKVTLPELPEGDILGVTISRSETKLAFYLNGDTSPSNLFVLDLGSGKYTKLTEALNPAIDRANLVEGKRIKYKSFDGLSIPAILYRPHQASSGAPAPALVWVHGGPGGQSRHGYSPAIQHLVNNGYAILAVNNRGSSGYGKTFFHKDDKQHGDVDLKDCIWGRKYLEGLGWIDRSKIGIIGGSYGGYMVAAALTFEPDAFDVGIDIFGVTNWLRTIKSIPPWWEAEKEALYAEIGDPAQEEQRLHDRSPLFHAKNIKKPLLVVQGANDPRVLKAESDEIVEAVKKNGIPVDYVIFPDEGHGFRNKANRIAASEAYVGFLDKYLKTAGGT